MTPNRTDLPLPVEIIRDIFELAAEENSEYAVKFALVSSWVQQWMENIIYRTVVLNFPVPKTELFMRTFDSKPPEFFARTVKNLHLSTMVPFRDAQKIISVCEGAKRVACWGSSSSYTEGLYQILPSHDVQQLSVKMETLMGNESISADTFPNLTHLEIVNPPYISSKTSFNWETLCLIPNLTHLALGEVFSHHHLYLVDIIQGLLTGCQSLQVLVIITEDTRFLDLLAQAGLNECDKIAVVPHFYSPEATELDYWKRAECEEWNLWQEAESIIRANSSRRRRVD
ncbi:hypothetical protein BDQ17DRAFT_1421173 [Cyathus striatus]|nr:hypothetical protein BDQ17DRAFT_1427108 [Cyathus striatus]KAF9010852.1 hypothetical protein BDQ17DRAFT_1421173 [Cyathus striatus]